MNDEALHRYIAEFQEKRGNVVPLSLLLSEFEPFQPKYSATARQPKDEEAAKAAAISRAVYQLFEELTKEPSPITMRPAKDATLIDFNKVAEDKGGSPKQRFHKLPNYDIELDSRFTEFVRALPRTLRGTKGTPPGKPGGASYRARLHEAVEALREARGRDEAVAAFLATYDAIEAERKPPGRPSSKQ